jgi:hypothetical protein
MVPERGRALNGACGDTAVRDVTYEAPYQEPQRRKFKIAGAMTAVKTMLSGLCHYEQRRCQIREGSYMIQSPLLR